MYFNRLEENDLTLVLKRIILSEDFAPNVSLLAFLIDSSLNFWSKDKNFVPFFIFPFLKIKKVISKELTILKI